MKRAGDMWCYNDVMSLLSERWQYTSFFYLALDCTRGQKQKILECLHRLEDEGIVECRRQEKHIIYEWRLRQ